MSDGDLRVTGGTVLTAGGSARADVVIADGRIVSMGGEGSASRGNDARPDTPEAMAFGGRTPSPHAAPGDSHRLPSGSGGDDSHPAGAEATTRGGRTPSPRESSSGSHRLDATGLVVVPGFVDLQCNGAAGVDLATEPERLWDVAAALPRWGVTAWLPTIVSSPSDVRARALATLRSGAPPGEAAATPLGLHLEGPFLAPERKGAHPAAQLVPPSLGLVEDEGWAAADGVALVTLAPELPGALDVVRHLVERGVVVSAGHSSATADEARAGLDAGISYVTHLFNAMVGFDHREPGLPGVALTDERATVGLIADGLHVDPAVVALVARVLGPRLSLVTDAVAALGAAPGPVRLGAVEAVARDDGVRLADGTLAGSTLSLDRAVRNLVAFAGRSRVDAVAAVTTTPARVLGLADRGVIAPGAVGDLVLLDTADEVVATVIGGRVAFDRREAAA